MSRSWSFSEEKILIDNYSTCTVFELIEKLPGRDEDSINCKIKRMRKQNKIITHKTSETVSRSHKERLK
jgi:hypothetical protein